MLSRGQAAQLRRVLWAWGHTAETLRQNERELARCRAAVDDAYNTLHSSVPTGMPRGVREGSVVERAVEMAQRRAEQYGEMLEQTQREAERALALKRAMDEAIDRLDPAQQTVLRIRYQDGLSWQGTAIKAVYSLSRVKGIEREALEALSAFVEIAPEKPREVLLRAQ